MYYSILLSVIGRTFFALWLICITAAGALAQDVQLTIYSARKEELIKPQLEEFTKRTGIKTRLVVDDAPKLIARLNSEGRLTPADVLLLVDVANVERAKHAALLKPVHSPSLIDSIPAAYRDPEGYWFGLSVRVRALVYNKALVNADQLSSYEALQDPKWRGKLLMRSSSHPYNISLIAAMIATSGIDKTQQWAEAIAKNMARPPQGGDRDQIKAVAAGEGAIALVNSYYYALMVHSAVPEDRKAAEKTALFFPNQNPASGELKGAHINLSVAAMVMHSHKDVAVLSLIEFLAGQEGQRLYADSNQEYPVNPAVSPSATLQSFGSYKPDATPLSMFAQKMQEAVKIADRAGWN